PVDRTPADRRSAAPGPRSAGPAPGADEADPTASSVRRGGLRGGQRERRERIVDAAVRMMAERDYEKIQVKDVADEAGVALGTLYRYFASKDHLFACALGKWGHGFGGRLVHPAGASALERVTAIYLKAARAFEGDARVYEMITQLECTRDARAAEIYAEFVHTQNRAFASALVDLPAEQHREIVWVMGAVLSEALRSRMLGLFDMAGVYERIETAARLILK
ncbi:helix-turn-helix domain-containing protein, partial [Actinocorallia longicatena]|uniref:TetR/AcrR family transcriptional regulator n=1 Tax=Actinocorallia longicatena TaxID=111803 RepID=UPI0031CF49E9